MRRFAAFATTVLSVALVRSVVGDYRRRLSPRRAPSPLRNSAPGPPWSSST